MSKGAAPVGTNARWLKRAAGLAFIALLLLPASLALRPPSPAGGPPPPEIRASVLSPGVTTKDASVNAWGLTARSTDGSFTLTGGTEWGIYNSPVFQSDFSFNAVGIAWKAEEPPGTRAVLEVRASPDSVEWSEWYSVELLDGTPSAPDRHSQLIVAYGRYLQYSVTLYAEYLSAPPIVKDIKITYIDSSQGPVPVRGQAGAPGRRPSDMSMPAVISRAEWGAGDSAERWPPRYQEWTKIAVHDTVTKNNDPNPAATVRAIWYYHANTQGWGDIGYNYLIDTFGNIYEGRYGGENATGGHVLQCYNPGSMGVALLGDYRYAEVTPEMANSLVSLLAAKTYSHNIDPLGGGNFGGTNYDGTYHQRWLYNIYAHRDVYGSCGNTHTDPGNLAYSRLPEFRNTTWSSFQPYRLQWISHDTPARMLVGASASVAVTVKNTGRAVWANNNNFRLGYRWYDQNGAEVIQAGGGNQRAELPQDVPYGQTVMIRAQISAPASPGTYTLQWDMVQDAVTWFIDQGNTPLNTTVIVSEATYVAEFAGQSQFPRFFPGDKREVYFELKNNGTATWYRSGAFPVALGTANPTDRSSAVATSGDWPSPARATSVDQERVLPGETGRFTFVATAPATPGVHREYFSLIAEGKAWFGPAMYLDFVVLPSGKQYFPELLRAYLGNW